jgi:hypothetical protein
MRTILAIDLAKSKSLFCWYQPPQGQVPQGTHSLRTVPSTRAAFREALLEQQVDRVVIEVCDMAGWIDGLKLASLSDESVATGKPAGACHAALEVPDSVSPEADWSSHADQEPDSCVAGQ